MTKNPCVYILASAKNGVLYIGVTSQLIQRIWQHKNSQMKGFTEKYHIHILVYYEQYQTMDLAMRREKKLKTWKRQWKINLIEKKNPDWQDLWESIQ
ncbi:MAG: GIY-YIG nuclease family protein [Mariprofundaceae bacterium]|nr:GIY-YIG nuclease family protein [Mariprofundaceae bacterium]